MTAETRSRTEATSAIATAKAELLLRWVAARPQGVRLGGGAYGSLRDFGLSRAEVHAAIDALVEEHRLSIAVGYAEIVLHACPAPTLAAAA